MGYTYINELKLSPNERKLLAMLDEMPLVHFVFRKHNGEHREAQGTRNLQYIPETQWPKSYTEDVSKKINYYDFDRQEWRSFSNGSLLDINLNSSVEVL